MTLLEKYSQKEEENKENIKSHLSKFCTDSKFLRTVVSYLSVESGEVE